MSLGFRILAAAAAVALLAASPASADLVHDLTGRDWQYDGGKAGDASDACAGAEVRLPLGSSSSGFAFTLLDPADNFVLPIGPGDVGRPVSVRATAFPAFGDQMPLETLRLSVWTADCSESVGKGQGPGLVTFKPTEPGGYVIQLAWSGLLGVHGEPGVPVPWAYHTDCQPFCAAYGPVLNSVLGYDFAADAS